LTCGIFSEISFRDDYPERRHDPSNEQLSRVVRPLAEGR